MPVLFVRGCVWNANLSKNINGLFNGIFKYSSNTISLWKSFVLKQIHVKQMWGGYIASNSLVIVERNGLPQISWMRKTNDNQQYSNFSKNNY